MKFMLTVAPEHSVIDCVGELRMNGFNRYAMYRFVANVHVPTFCWKEGEDVNYVIAGGQPLFPATSATASGVRIKKLAPFTGCNASCPLQCSRYERRVPRRGLHCRDGHHSLHALSPLTRIPSLMHFPTSKATKRQPNLHPSKILRTALRQQAKATIQRGAHMILL